MSSQVVQDVRGKTDNYEIRYSEKTGEHYCTCLAWRFSAKRNGGIHTCKHLVEFLMRR